MSSNDINSSLIENRRFEPSSDFVNKARIKAADLDALNKQAEQDYEGFWADQARQHIDWNKPFSKILDQSNAPHLQVV